MDTYEGSSIQRNFSETILHDSTVIFSYIFENISQLNGPIESPPSYINNLPWRILLMANPQTSSAISALTHKRNLSIYLQCNPDNVASNWSCYATADISLMPMMVDKKPITKSIKHLFSPKENDWGFKCFETFEFLLHPESGYCVNDSIAVQMHVNAEIPHGVFWDSKKHTGFVGLTNQGATCYMNSLLQTVFFTNELRRAIYCMPTEADDAKKSVAFALQRVFYDLQFCDKPVGTKRLTNSFGWDTMDSFMQHDVQEFLRVLLAKIETKMKGTSLEGIVPKLVAGKMRSYIRCKNVDYNSSREETFYDIQLSVKSKKDIYESFQDYVAPEILTGENKYFAGEYGLQEAEKGVIFKSLPPVLHLHLMRFQYDSWNDICVKFNDHFEFYENIDLTNYLELNDAIDEKDKKALTEYRLHAVLVHSGDNHGGHYVVYINVDAKGKWYKFDDDLVSICTAKEAIEQNYGGSEEELKNNIKTCSSAYMLSYIQVSEIPNILKEINVNDINSEFIEHLNEVKRIEEAERNIKYNQNNIVINIILEDNLDVEDMQNLLTSNKVSYITFRFDVTKTLNEFLDLVSNSFKMPKSRFRLWPLLIIHDYVRPIYLDCSPTNSERTIQSLKELRNPWYFLLQFSNPLNLYQIQNFDPKQQILVIYKMYQFNGKNEINFLGMSYRQFGDQIIDVINEVQKTLEEQENVDDCDFKVYEENSGILLNLYETLDKCFKIKKSETNCLVLVFEKMKINRTCASPSYQDFKLDQHNRFEIFFIDKSDKSKTPNFTLQLPENATLEQMALEVGKKINAEKNKVQFFKTNSNDSLPLKIDNTILVKEIFRTRSGPKLFYQKLSMDVNQLQNKLKFPLTYLLPNLRDEKELIVYVDKNGSIIDLIQAVKVELKTADSDLKYRLTKIENNSIGRICCDDIKFSDLDQFYENDTQQATIKGNYRVEEINKFELLYNGGYTSSTGSRGSAGGSNEYLLIPVMHFNKSVRNSFGIPFFVTVKSEQTFEQICEQIRKKLLIPEAEWSTKYKICLVIPHSPYNITYLTEDDLQKPVLLEHFRENVDGSFTFHIGLDHVSKLQKKSRDLVEKSLKIYN